jgi:hypothetical protein
MAPSSTKAGHSRTPEAASSSERDAFSTYDSKRIPDGEPFARGINSFQLYGDGTRWWIVTIFWDAEAPDKPIPAK